uniref:Uncharacterized protein n=1 Tax=Manihot esculenta TaxID=3983 RepID=A0A2C9VP56_MANES
MGLYLPFSRLCMQCIVRRGIQNKEYLCKIGNKNKFLAMAMPRSHKRKVKNLWVTECQVVSTYGIFCFNSVSFSQSSSGRKQETRQDRQKRLKTFKDLISTLQD